MNALLGIDISTTGAKALLIDEQGKVLATSTHTYSLSTPKPLWSEQDPEDWWQAIQLSIKGAMAEAKLATIRGQRDRLDRANARVGPSG